MTILTSKRALTERQYELLYAVRRGDSRGGFASTQDLAKEFGVAKQSITCSLQFLADRGLVQKHRQTRDQRRVLCWKLTAAAYLYLTSDPDVVVLELLKAEGI